MFRILVLFSILIGLAACAGQGSPGNSPTSLSHIVITNGTVVDGRGSEPIPDGIVVLEDDRITFVGRAADYSQPSDAQVINAQGGTILPGFIDTHVHSASDPAIRRQFLVSGVTAVCDLGSPLEDIPQFDEHHLDQDPIARGFHSGPIITAPGGLPDVLLQAGLNYEVGTPDEARAAVVDLHNHGVDVIKVYLQGEVNGVRYSMLAEQDLTAIVDEAHTLGLLVRSHVTYASLLDMAVQAGVDIIEHVPVNATQTEAQSLSDSQMQGFLESNEPLKVFFAELFPQYETQLETMVEAGIVMIPTLDRPYGDFYRAANPTREQQLFIEIILEIVRRFHELGGVVGLGTDYNINFGIEAGTRISASVCGHATELGTLEPGMLADVIVVDGDPLEDLQAMGQVVLVMKNGEFAVASEVMLEENRWLAELPEQD